MWLEMNLLRKIFFAAIMTSCILCSGCWITRNWRSYSPIGGVVLQKGVRSYVGFFVPRITGKHALLFSVRNGNDDRTETPVNLRFHGRVQLWHGGRFVEHEFDRSIQTAFVPGLPHPLYVSDGIYMERAEDSEDDYGRFSVTIEGDLDAFLSRNPECDITVRFIESE